MEYLLKKNILPPHILKDISDYNRLDLKSINELKVIKSELEIINEKEFLNIILR